MFNLTFEQAADAVATVVYLLPNADVDFVAMAALKAEYPEAIQYLADDYSDPGSEEHDAAWSALGAMKYHAKVFAQPGKYYKSA